MDKERASVEKYIDCMRSEIINKFDIKGFNNKEITREEIELIIKKVEDRNKEISNRKIEKKYVKPATLEEKRSEIVGKFIDDLNKEIEFQDDDEVVDLKSIIEQIKEEMNLINSDNIEDDVSGAKKSEIINDFKRDDELRKEAVEEKLVSIIEKIEKKNDEINQMGVLHENVSNEQAKELMVDNGIKVNEGNSKKEVEEYFNYRRSEVINKFSVDYKIKGQVTREELLAIMKAVEEKNEEISKKAPIKKEVKLATLEDKRSEIAGKFVENEKDVKTIELDNQKEEIKDETEENIKASDETKEIGEVKGASIEEMNDNELETLEDKKQDNVENVSVAMIVVIVLVCAILGTLIGYMLYRLAMNNSNTMAMIFRWFI